MPDFHQQYYDTLSFMQNCFKVTSPLFTYLTIYLLHTGVVQMFLQCFGYVKYKYYYFKYYFYLHMTAQTSYILDLSQNKANENPNLQLKEAPLTKGMVIQTLCCIMLQMVK